MAAKHRSLVQDQIADVTECSICTEIFTNPKVLPCVHTFCLHCLESYGKDKKPGDQMVCPICRKDFLIPDGGFFHLPNNFFIGKVVEIGKLAMTPASKSLCALCPEGGNVLAQLFCVDCEQNLCSNCANIHRKSRCSQNHQVVELGSQLNSSEINLRNSYCDHHPGEQIKMFCYEDNVAICLICCVESHQSHRCVNVNKAAGEFTQLLKHSMRKVADRLPQCEEVTTKLDKFKKEFEEEVFKAEVGIRDATTQLKKLIDQHTEILLQNLKSLREQNFKAFEITKQDVDRFKVMIDSFSRYSEELLARGSPVDVCRAANQMLTRAHELELLPANCSGDCFRCDSVSFHSSNIVDFLGEYGKNIAVGELTVTQSSHRLLKFRQETSAEKSTDDVYVLLSPPLAVHPERKDETSKSDTSRSKSSSSLDALKTPKSIIVKGVSSQTVDIVEFFLENPRKGGGPIKEIEFNESDEELLVIFEDELVADKFLGLESLSILENTFYVSSPEKKKMKDEKRKSLEDSVESREEAEEECRAVEVHGVGSSEVAEFIAGLMKNRRRGGGEIETESFDEMIGILTLRFQDRKIADRFLEQKSISILGKSYDIHAPVKEEPKPKTKSIPPEEVNEFNDRDAEERSRIVEVHGVQSWEVAESILALLENKRRGGGPVEEDFLNETNRILTVKFRDKKFAETLIDRGSIRYKNNTLMISRPSRPASVEILKAEGATIVVSNIPEDMSECTLQMIIGNKRIIGEGEVTNIVYGKGQRSAVITLSDPEIAEELIERGSIVYKNHTLAISRPSVRKADKGLKEPTHTISGEGKHETPGKYAAPHEDASSKDVTIDVSNIPEDMEEDILKMIIESKRLGGGGEVKKIVFEQGGGSAVITLSDPEVVKRLLHQESVVFKGSRLMITRHIEEDRSQKRFPLRKRTNVSSSEKEQPSISDRTIKVSYIPSDVNKETLKMIFESKRNSGGEIDSIVYNQGQGTAVITFKSQEVAASFLEKDIVEFKGRCIWITKHEDQAAGAEDDEDSDDEDSDDDCFDPWLG